MMPDHVSALVAYLRTNSDVTAIAPAARIGMEIPSGAQMPRSNVIIRKSGGAGSDDYAPYYRGRVDIHCYGANGYETMRLARAVQAALIPQDRKSTRIHAQGCVIAGVGMESGHIGLETPEGWSYVVTVYSLQVYEVAVV
jgi:hypothetical protein